MSEPWSTALLPGWELCWIRLEVVGGGESELALRRERIAQELRSQWTPADLGEDATVAAMRRLFKAAGTDPSRYRPSSEALLRRLLKGEELARIHPLVDLNNQISIALRVPSCVMRAGSFGFPGTLRSGLAGEILYSPRTPLNTVGKHILPHSPAPFRPPSPDPPREPGQAARRVGRRPCGHARPPRAHPRRPRSLQGAPTCFGESEFVFFKQKTAYEI